MVSDLSDFKSTLKHLDGIDNRTTVHRLSSGIRLIHTHTPEDDRCLLGIMARGGCLDEIAPWRAGTAHFLEHMLYRGSSKFPHFAALADAYESLGGVYNAETAYEYTYHWYMGLSPTLGRAGEILLNLFFDPTLEGIDIERRIILEELQGELNENGISSDLDLHIRRLLWPSTRMELPIVGTSESIGSMTVEDLKSFRLNTSTLDRLAICAVTADPAEETLRTLERLLSHVSVPHKARNATVLASTDHVLPAPQTAPPPFFLPEADGDYDLQFSCVTPGQGHRDAPTDELIVRALGDGFSARLIRELRESQGLAYDLDVDLDRMTQYGLVSITASMSSSNVDPLLVGLKSSLSRLVDHGLSSDELLRAKRRAVTDTHMHSYDPSFVGPRALWRELTGQSQSLRHEVEQYLAVSAANVQERLHDLFARVETPRALALSGPPSDVIENILRPNRLSPFRP